MAVAAVTTSGVFRLDDAEANTGWGSVGGGQGPSAEASFPYQGNNLVNKKITGTGGVSYDPTGDAKTAESMASGRAWIVKGIVTDYGGLNALESLYARYGSAAAAYWQFLLAGSNSPLDSYKSYPARGGLVVIPVNHQVTSLRTQSGSPAEAACDFFGFVANFDSSQAKSENVGCDAIDLVNVGGGLLLTGGTAPDPAGVFQNFFTFDEGTIGNRYGLARAADGGLLLAFGTWIIGSAGVATRFNDVGAKVLWPEGFVPEGFNKLQLNLGNAGTTITDGSTHTGLGKRYAASGHDTRFDVEWTGTAGVGSATHKIENCRQYTANSAVTIDGADIQTRFLTQGGATIQNSIIRTDGHAAGQVTISDVNLSLLNNVDFIQSGLGHAIVINTPGSYTLNGLNFSGYGADGSGAAAIYNNSGGLVTLNVSGGNTPTVLNGASASTVVNNSKTLTFNVSFAGATPADYEWRLYEKDPASGTIGTVELDGAENETGSQIIYSYNYSVDQDVVLQIIATGYREALEEVTLINQNQTFSVILEEDPNL